MLIDDCRKCSCPLTGFKPDYAFNPSSCLFLLCTISRMRIAVFDQLHWLIDKALVRDGKTKKSALRSAPFFRF